MKNPLSSHTGTLTAAALILILSASTAYLAVTRPTLDDIEQARLETRTQVLESQAELAKFCRPVEGRCNLHKPITFTVDFFGMQYTGHSRNYIEKHVLVYGAFEKYILFFLRDVMKSLNPEAGVFVDVGANTGQHSLFMSKHAGTVHAIEPYDGVLQPFREMIEGNAIDNIVVHPVGLGDEPGTVPFFEPPENNKGTGSFVEGFKTSNKYLTELKIVTGDSIFSGAEPVAVDVMKIDIEGYEKPALVGLTDTLLASRPLVVMEITIDAGLPIAFQSEEELRAAFPPDYEFYFFNKLKSHPVQGRYVLEPFAFDFGSKRQEDLVAVPVEKRDRMQLTSPESPEPETER